MFCAIYKSRRKRDTYLYLAAKGDFSQVPESLLDLLGEPIHILDLELSPARPLAQENVLDVISNLRERGWHLQIPRETGMKPPH